MLREMTLCPIKKVSKIFIWLIFASLLLLIIPWHPGANTALAQSRWVSIRFELKQGLNGISIPVDESGITTAEDLADAIENCDKVKYWDVEQQTFVEYLVGSETNNFQVIAGYPYFVNVTADTTWYVSGYTPEELIFELNTTENTDVNVIALPFDRDHLTTAEELLEDIPYSDTVWYWDTVDIGFVGHPADTTINNFAVTPGYPYFVNITEDVQWPVLTVSFSASATTGVSPFTANFSVQSLYGGVPPYTYSWDLNGDGVQNSDDVSPFYVYSLPGTYDATLTLTDNTGAEAMDTQTIMVSGPPSATASATPTNGLADLTVSFSCLASDPDGTIDSYEWDFDGDDTYDWRSVESGTTTHLYTNNGQYHATVRVTDNDGMTAVDSVIIIVGSAPVASASIEEDQTGGVAPLAVDFIGSGLDEDGSIVLYEWDFNGDGVFDWSSSESGSTTHTFDDGQTYIATLRVTDDDGLTSTSSTTISVLGSPTALPRAFPINGNAPLTVNFFCDGADADSSIVDFAWDFDGDGIFDWSLGYSVNTAYTYYEAGNYEATLQVKDNDGLIGTSAITITVGDPVPSVAVIPENGGAPLHVNFRGQIADPSRSVKAYNWDFDGNDTIDAFIVPADFFGSARIDSGYNSRPVFVDIDNDGNLDLFVGNSDGTLFFYQNDGQEGVPYWYLMGESIDSEQNTIDAGRYSSPAFVDIDNDGDLDLFLGNNDGTLIFYRNSGDALAPEWTSQGVVTDGVDTTIDTGSVSSPAFLDIDGDGDQDLFIGRNDGRLSFYKNDGDVSAPSWIVQDLVEDTDTNVIDVGYNNAPLFTDIDDDGDFDLFVGESNGTLYFYRNVGTQNTPSWAPGTQVTDINENPIDIGSQCVPAMTDIDTDGDVDLFMGEYYGGVFFYRNNGAAASPVWELANPAYDHFGVDKNSAPAVADIDGDGDLDAFIGEYSGKVHFFENTGSVGNHEWSYRRVIADVDETIIDLGYNSVPVFADIDNDGDLDLLVGESNGTLAHYENTGDLASPQWTSAGKFADADGEMDVGSHSKPVFTDIDADGDLDLFMGEYSGRVFLYKNEGDNSTPSWTNQGEVLDDEGNAIDTGYYSSVAFEDIDHDGDMDLFVGGGGGSGEENSRIRFFLNTGDAAVPNWHLADEDYLRGTRFDTDLINYTIPRFADFDGDGDADLFVGEELGQVFYYPGVSYLYETPGDYQATLSVVYEDEKTLIGTAAVKVLAESFPTAFAFSDPYSGPVPLDVSFTGIGNDPGGFISLFEWDFDGDGTYDWSSTSDGITTHTYDLPETYHATLRVTDNDGNQATQTSVITANLGIVTQRTGSFNPFTGGTGTITSTLMSDAVISIWIVDAEGNIIRTLVFEEARTVDTYEDIWDGRDIDGDIVASGVYYFIIGYTANGVSDELNLRTVSDYPEEIPSRSFNASYSPYEDDFFELTYDVNDPSEVSIYFWRGQNNNPGSVVEYVNTLFTRELRGQGSHTEIWEGLDDKGIPVSTDYGYLPTIYAWPIADNGIIILGEKPDIMDVAAEPNYFSPAYNPYSASAPKQTLVTFNLTKAANVLVSITNAKGVLVESFMEAGKTAGGNHITWDGKDTKGNYVNEGVYRIGLTAIDNAGEQSLKRSAFAVVYY